jgi:multidrug efflux system membrane fusion protein
VAAARKQDVRVILTGIGNISAQNTAVVRSRVEGELKTIHFTEGQTVRAGAVLAELDSRSFDIAVAQAQAQLAKSQAVLKNAQVDLERYKDLLAKDSIARQQVDTQDALVAQLQATLKSDQTALDNAKLQQSYTRITAPIGGRLGLKQADLGNVVRASDANGLVTITQTQPISALFSLPEVNLPQVQRKLRAKEVLVVEAWDRDQRNLLATGRVTTTDNTIDPVTGTIKLKAEFPNADGSLFPNQFVNVRLQVNTVEGATVVPSTAVQRGAQGAFVYAVGVDSSVSVRRVRLGATEGDWVVVQGDVALGERVVTDGADRLREGAKVEVITPPARPGGAGGAGGPGSAGGMAAAPFGQGASAAGKPQRPGSAPAAASPSAPPGPPVQAPGAASTSRPAATPAAPPAGGRPDAWIDSLPPEFQERIRRTLERIGPEQAAKVHKMSPEERRAFFQQLRQRQQQPAD